MPSLKNLFISAITVVTLAHCGKATNFPQQQEAANAEESSSARVATYLATASSSCEMKASDIRFSQLVDVDFYLRSNPDVANAYRALSGATKNAEVVKHFVCNGQFEGRRPNLLYDEGEYLGAHLDIKDAVRRGVLRSGFDHLALYGQFEMAAGSRKTVVGKFAPIYNMIPEVANRNISGPPIQMFDPNYYKMNYPVAIAGWVSPLAHYIQIGQRTGFRPSAAWNEGKYRSRNRDVSAAIMSGALASGLEHYLASGRNELGRYYLGDQSAMEWSEVNNVPPLNLAVTTDEILTIVRSNTVSGNVEVERKVTTPSMRNRFQILDRSVLPVSASAARYSDFTLRGQDLVQVHFSGGRVNLSVYTRVSGFRQASEHYTTPFGEQERENIAFRFMSNGDLVGIKHKNSGSQSIEVHVVSRSSGYRQFIQQTGSRLKDNEIRDIKSIAVIGRDIIVIGKLQPQNQSTVFRLDSRVSYQGYFPFNLMNVPGTTLDVVQALTVPSGNAMLLSLDSFSLYAAQFGTTRYTQIR